MFQVKDRQAPQTARPATPTTKARPATAGKLATATARREGDAEYLVCLRDILPLYSELSNYKGPTLG